MNQYFHLSNSKMCLSYFYSVMTLIGKNIWSQGHGFWKFTGVLPYFLCHFRLSAFAELASYICLFLSVLQLLMKSPQKRLVDMYTLQNSPFFKVINFTNVIEKKVKSSQSFSCAFQTLFLYLDYDWYWKWTSHIVRNLFYSIMQWITAWIMLHIHAVW